MVRGCRDGPKAYLIPGINDVENMYDTESGEEGGDDDEHDDDAGLDVENIACEKCQDKGDDEKMLICEKDCGKSVS